MVRITAILGAWALTTTTVYAAPTLASRQNLPDPAGEKNLGNAKGVQFIGGQCATAADCASTCCATLPQGGKTIGVCSGVGAQFQAGKQGCGFEGLVVVPVPAPSAGANTPAPAGNPEVPLPGAGAGAGAPTPGIAPPGTPVKASDLKPDVNGARNVGNGKGAQFITGECLGDVDCASGCCALVNTGAAFFGICSGPLANIQAGKQGCGFPVGGQRIPANS